MVKGDVIMSEKKIDVKTLKKSKAYKSIRDDLIEQLKNKGADISTLRDIVEDYMSMWVTKELLKYDIEISGLRIPYDNGGGQTGFKDNSSVDRQIKVNAQMLKLLSELGLKADNIRTDADDEL